jgi:hypothetical protein
MRTRTITTLALVMSLVGLSPCLAEDPHMGTWKLNGAKSEIGAGFTEEHPGCLRGGRR